MSVRVTGRFDEGAAHHGGCFVQAGAVGVKQ
jgi:hypothetical protein